MLPQPGIGLPNLVVVGGIDDLTLLGSASDGSLNPIGVAHVGVPTNFLTVADLDGDQQGDIVQTDGVSVGVLLRRGTGFSYPRFFGAGRGPVSITAADLDRDGRMDLISPINSLGLIAVMHNTCGG